MQFEDPKSVLEAAAAKPERTVDPHALLARGRRLRRARYAAVAAGLAVTVAGASASIGLITGRDGPRPAGTACEGSGRSVSIFARTGASDADVARLRRSLEGDPDVELVELVPAEETAELFRALTPRSPIQGPNVPAHLRVMAVDEDGAERIAAMRGGAIGHVLRDFTAEGLDCLRQHLCDRSMPLEAVVFLRDGVTRRDVLDLQARVLAIRGVEHVEYVSKRESYRMFQGIYEGQPELHDTISPTDLPASLRVKAANEEAIQAVDELDAAAIDEVRWGAEIAERLCRGVEATETETREPPVTATPAPATSDPVAEVTLLSQECGSNLSGLGRARFPDTDGGTWCRFALRIDNQGEVPVVLDPDRQRLASKIGTRLPQQDMRSGTRLFDPIPPGESKLGKLVFLIRENEPVVALEIEIAGVLRPLQFGVDGDCAAGVTRDQADGCYLEHEFPPSFLISGNDVLQGTAEVELYHCGIMPIAFDKRSWIADPPPFDATNAPEDFVGRGWMLMELGSLSATYLDESGVSFDVEAVEDWKQPPCE